MALHHRNSKDIVINRLGFKTGIQIIGGVQRLLHYAKQNYNKIITWSDNRWSTGKIYEKAGFVMEKNMNADYSYFDNKKVYRIPTQSMQKKKIGCPDHMTEHEFTLSKGIYRIYDCGKKRWVFTK